MEEMEINEKERASDAMMRRMPAYYRRLLELEGLGFTVISSKELARRMGLTDSQIRHDFNAFGGFGRRGRGYTVELLRKSIGDILDINRKHEMIIIGGAAVGALIIGNSGSDLKALGGGLGKVFKGPQYKKQDFLDCIFLVSKLMKTLRVEGPVACIEAFGSRQLR